MALHIRGFDVALPVHAAAAVVRGQGEALRRHARVEAVQLREGQRVAGHVLHGHAGGDGAQAGERVADAVGAEDGAAWVCVILLIDGGLGIDEDQARGLRLQRLLKVEIADPEGLLRAAEIVGGDAVFLPQHIGVHPGVGHAGAKDKHVHGVFVLTVEIGHAANAVIVLRRQHIGDIAKHGGQQQEKTDKPQPEAGDACPSAHLRTPLARTARTETPWRRSPPRSGRRRAWPR